MSFAATALRLFSGVIVWALHFAAIYGWTAVACARGMPATVPWVLGIATLAAGLAAVAIVLAGLRARERFDAWMMSGIAAFALVAILWEALTVLIVAPCL